MRILSSLTKLEWQKKSWARGDTLIFSASEASPSCDKKVSLARDLPNLQVSNSSGHLTLLFPWKRNAFQNGNSAETWETVVGLISVAFSPLYVLLTQIKKVVLGGKKGESGVRPKVAKISSPLCVYTVLQIACLLEVFHGRKFTKKGLSFFRSFGGMNPEPASGLSLPRYIYHMRKTGGESGCGKWNEIPAVRARCGYTAETRMEMYGGKCGVGYVCEILAVEDSGSAVVWNIFPIVILPIRRREEIASPPLRSIPMRRIFFSSQFVKKLLNVKSLSVPSFPYFKSHRMKGKKKALLSSQSTFKPHTEEITIHHILGQKSISQQVYFSFRHAKTIRWQTLENSRGGGYLCKNPSFPLFGSFKIHK